MTNSSGAHATDHHTTGCFWQHDSAAWVCGGQPPTDGPFDPGGPERPMVDVRDMFVVHTALMREFRLAPAAVGRVPAGARRQATAVERHLRLLCELLHHHHAGEDELLWPPLRARLPDAAVALLDEAEAQHTAIDQALAAVAAARRAWAGRLDIASRDALVDTLQALHALLAEHLDAEECTLLPLAAAHLTATEWAALGARAAAGIPKSTLPLVFGMFAYEGDPEVLAEMLHAAPPPVRLVVPRIAPRLYARRAAQVYGTRQP